MKTFNPESFKQQFPVFQQPENENLIYLDNAATMQKPQCVLEAITQYYLTMNANAHRATHPLAQRATDCLENTRQKQAKYLGANQEEIFFCKGTTEGINLIATSLAQRLSPKDEIIISTLEHHANYLPWYEIAKTKNLTLKFFPLHESGIEIEQLSEYVTDKTKIISMTAASNVLGQRVEINKIRRVIKPFNPIIIIDGAQSVTHEKIDVKKLDIDFFIFSAHKFYGPMGLGVVYGKKALLDEMPPWQLGGNMVKRVCEEAVEYHQAPYRFEAGTLPVAQINGLNAVLDFVNAYDFEQWARHKKNLLSTFHESLEGFSDIQLLTQTHHNVGIVNFSFHQKELALKMTDLGYWLDTHNVAVRIGKHCAHPLYDKLGISSGLRISLAPYNTHEDKDRCLNLIEHWIKENRKKSNPLKKNTAITAQRVSHLELEETILNCEKEKYRLLAAFGEKLIIHPSIEQTDYEVQGCHTKTWLYHCQESEKNYFFLHSVSKIINGLCYLALFLYQGKTANEIEKIDWKETIKKIGIESYLSTSRLNGFEAIVQAIKAASSK